LPGSVFGISPFPTIRSVLAASLLFLLAVAGCGGAEPATESAGTGAGAGEGAGGNGTIVAALGDSITAGSPGYDPDPARRSRLGAAADGRSQYEYWAERADPELRLRNCGVLGERTDEIARRLRGCADGADALIVQGGINDIAQGRPVAAAARDLRSMVRRGRRLGLDAYLVDVLPWNNGHPVADPRIARLNRLIDQIGRVEDVPVLGFHDALEDPAKPGTMRLRLTADGDHPSVAGYRVLGELVAARLGG
jgi:lysophospholipase L1-like esterase